MKSYRRNTLALFHLLFSCLAVLGMLCLPGLASGLSPFTSRSVTGCNEGMVYTDDKQFPQESLGNIPDRIANYEMVFQKGSYAIRISSRFEFIPYIYKMINGKYQWAGLPTRVSFQNDRSGAAFFYYDFKANHLTDALSNSWLLQIKPVPEAQTVPHRIRVITKVLRCPRVEPDRPQLPCPPGECGEASTFGTSNCRKSPGCAGGMCGTPGCP